MLYDTPINKNKKIILKNPLNKNSRDFLIRSNSVQKTRRFLNKKNIRHRSLPDNQIINDSLSYSGGWKTLRNFKTELMKEESKYLKKKKNYIKKRYNVGLLTKGRIKMLLLEESKKKFAAFMKYLILGESIISEKRDDLCKTFFIIRLHIFQRN